VSSFALQLWITAGFAGMAVAAVYATAPNYTQVWPYLFGLISLLALASIFRPEAPKLGAATGALLAMVGIARVYAVMEFYVPYWEHPHAILHVLLWGLHIVVGLRWPQVVYESSLRHALAEARDHPEEPPLTPEV